MSSATIAASKVRQSLTWKVEGMDCGSCAATLRTALENLPGVSEVAVSVPRERLTLTLSGEATSREQIEGRVRKLGFGPTMLSQKSDAPAPEVTPAETGGCGHDHSDGHSKSHGHDHDHGKAHDPAAHAHAHAHAGDAHGDHPGHDPHAGCNHDNDHGHAHSHGKTHSHAGPTHDHAGCDHAHHDHGPAHHDHDHHGHAPAHAADPGRLTWKVSGMDCASCAGTVRTALERLPGVRDIAVSVTNETLSLKLASGGTTADAITAQIAKLGYGPEIQQAAVPAIVRAAEAPKRWWQTSKARVAITAGALLVVAYIAGELVPAASFWFFVAATLLAIAPITRRAIAAAMAGAPFTIEMLMTIAAAGALFIGAIEEAAVVVFLFAVGEVLEGVAANKARSGIRALAALVPKTAWLDEGGSVREVKAEALRIGQTVLVRPGDRVPADGTVLEGHSGVDESPITGESVPKAKEPGAPIFAGSINQEAALRIRVEKAAEDNTIARIVTLVEEAQDAKAPTERFIDRFSRIYMPFIVGLSALVAVLPPLLGGGDWSSWIYRGLTLLLIGCPCALVISVPAAIASSLSMAARRGLLVKGGAVIEELSRVRSIAFDKTGTLTWGRPVVTDIVPLDGDARSLLSLAAAVERESSHPLARAIAERAADDGAPQLSASAARAVAGKGMEGVVAGARIFIGAPRFAAERGALAEAVSRQISALEEQGKTVVVVQSEAQAVGLIALRDEPRPDARAAIAELRSLGITPIMLTGDNRRTGAAIARDLGIDVQAEMMPEAKVAAVRQLAAQGHVAMVGDGINDAPALAAAHVGIAMGSGTDVALEAADAALLKSRVADVGRLVRLSRGTMANIRQNIAIALGLKLVFLVTTVTGTTGLWLAIFADTGATVLVTLNALRLLGFFRDEESAPAEPSQRAGEALASA
ncbi:heavy metal translocating P-type ATPase [Bosea sp. PAMC 26642]|uniref:heavy metal translocating P-type ATPase n=1 Tax=Bosea sp. (strain PAMC 26642) TaxID=1792307 RepID=UPI000AED2BB6|nr:heavy metal translocating P-type ATPase [Bosea sp. PAMC 26642]